MNKNITQYDDKGREHGYCEIYRPGGGLAYKTTYRNGKEVGYEEYYKYYDNSLEKVFYII